MVLSIPCNGRPMHLMTGFYGVLWFLRFDIDAAQTYLAARTKPLVPGDPVHKNWHGTWYPRHVLEVRDDDVIVYWAEAQHQLHDVRRHYSQFWRRSDGSKADTDKKWRDLQFCQS